MKILGFQPESYLDWNAGLASVIYTGNCNFRCYGCHAGGLIRKTEEINSEAVLKKLLARKRFINRVVICGGEPTLERDLPEFLKYLKDNGFLVKLDTNGSNANVVKNLLEEKLIDYVAMDIKAPPSLYGRVIGFENESSLDISSGIEQSIAIIQTAPDYELRTTFFPIYRNQDKKDFSWMTNQEIQEMSNWVGKNVANPEKVKWYIQKFKARSAGEMINERFAKENLPKEYHETPANLLREYRDAIKLRFPLAEIR